MQTLTIRLSTQEVADGLFVVLDAFHPEMNPSARGGYDVTVALDQNPTQLTSVLDALYDYSRDGNDGPAVIEFEGRKYSLDAYSHTLPFSLSPGRDRVPRTAVRLPDPERRP